MSEIVENYIREIRDAIITSQLNHEIWWIFKDPDSRVKYLSTMNNYTLFFQASIHAHFVALLVALYRLYETRKDTYNIPVLLRLLEEERSISEDRMRELKSMHLRAKPIWKKVGILRNEAFGHRLSSSTVQNTFEKADTTSNEIGHLIKLTCELLNTATRARSRQSNAFNLSARQDTLEMLEDLKLRGNG